MTRPLASSIGVFLVAAGITSVFFIDFCSLVYQCGCRSLWAGAATHCNIHLEGVRHCPWCAAGVLGQAAVYGGIVGAQGFISFRLPQIKLFSRSALAAAAFPVVGGMFALVFGFAHGYWG